MTARRSLLDLRAFYGPRFVGSLIVRPRGGHNMGQFLFEVMSIALAGGLGGLTVAVLIVLGVSQVSTEGTPAMEYLLRPVVSWPIVSLSVGTLLRSAC